METPEFHILLTSEAGKEIYSDTVNLNELVCIGDDLSNLGPTDHPVLLFQIPTATTSRTLEYFITQSDYSILEGEKLLEFMKSPEFLKKRSTAAVSKNTQMS